MAQQEIRPPTTSLLPGHADEAGQASSDRVIQAYEQERLRLAREIHDGPAQVLANAIFELEYFERLLERDPDAVKGQLAQLKRDIRDGLADVRRFIYDLRPPALSEMGLFPALARYASDYQKQFGVAALVQMTGEPCHLPASTEVAVFRIVQEALQNVQKHALASHVIITGTVEGQKMRITVEDDGHGFEVADVSARNSKNFGLTCMQERADLIGAEMYIDSAPGQGTRVTLTVPMD